MSDTPKLYDPENRDYHAGLLLEHQLAMTNEGLHSKVDIAIELAWRDQQIFEAKAELTELRKDSARLDWLLDRGAGGIYCRDDLDSDIEFSGDAAMEAQGDE